MTPSTKPVTRLSSAWVRDQGMRAVVVTIDQQEFVLTDGDSISFDSGRLHQVENRGNRKAVLVSAITPPAF